LVLGLIISCTIRKNTASADGLKQRPIFEFRSKLIRAKYEIIPGRRAWADIRTGREVESPEGVTLPAGRDADLQPIGYLYWNNRLFMKLILPAFMLCLLSTPAVRGQYTVAIPPTAIVVDSTAGSSGVGKFFWICAHDTLTGSGVDMTYFMEEGSYFSGSGISKNAYMKTLSYIGGSGIDDSIWYETGAAVMLNPAYDSLCASIVFDYTDAPVPGCAVPSSVRNDPRIIHVNVYPNPATDFVAVTCTDPGNRIEALALYDERGRRIRVPVSTTAASRKAGLHGLPSGMFMLEVVTTRGTAVHWVNKR